MTALGALVAAFRARPDAGWGFTHCLPWEYAGLCAALWRASAQPAAAAAAWRPLDCFRVNEHGRPQMSGAMWESLAAGPEELAEAYRLARVPRGVEPNIVLARCVRFPLALGPTDGAGRGTEVGLIGVG